LLDLYKRTPTGSNVNVSNPDNDQIPENMYRDDDDPDGWIHRDKLAKIESEELQAAGINLATARRTISKGGKRTQSKDRTVKESEADLASQKRQRITSPVEEEEDHHDVGQANWDLRTPQEIAADESARLNQVYANPLLRKSGSRIPVLTSSPLPIPQQHLERETPLPRSRGASGSGSDPHELVTPKVRTRGNSVGSQVLLDEEGMNGAQYASPSSNKSPTPSSPTKTKTSKSPVTGATAPNSQRRVTPAPRKTSNLTKSPPSATATPSPVARPGTRSGEADRPRTAINRPEGEAPWLATMYKTDPRLPPDQQIIPTHAKRQQQAQWTEEGAIPSTYDREFSPLAIHTENSVKQATPPAPVLEKTDEENAWPLKPMLSVRSTSTTGRPGTSGSITGGYSTMPKVVQTPPVGVLQSPRGSHFTPSRVQQMSLPPEEPSGKNEKGCGCCIVM
jgi:hypothetical protein